MSLNLKNPCHVTISVKNMEESLRFWRDIMGLPIKSRFSGREGVEIAFLGDGETAIELACDQNHPNISIGQDISVGFVVASIQETIEYLRQKGIAAGEIIQPNQRVRFFFASDPNGMRVQFVEYSEKESS
jgi:lactoylglutathione lyase